MLILKRVLIVATKNRFEAFYQVKLGDVVAADIRSNRFGRRKSPAPYILTWKFDLGFTEDQKFVYIYSLDEGREKVEEAIRTFISQMLE